MLASVSRLQSSVTVTDLDFPVVFSGNYTAAISPLHNWYCSNNYSESSEPTELCYRCETDEFQPSKHSGSSKKPRSKSDAGINSRSEYSDDKIKQHDGEVDNSEKGKSPTGAPSPRTSTRRYKLLKDVMC